MHVEFSPEAQSLGSCVGCGERTPLFVNCANQECRTQYLRCESCTADGSAATCGTCAVPA